MSTIQRLATTEKGMLIELEERVHGRASTFVAAIDRTMFLAHTIRHVAGELGASVAEMEQAYLLVTQPTG